MIYTLEDRVPQIHDSCFVADNATLIGSVVMEQGSSVWFNVVVRADHDIITIGEGSNVQDASVLHTDHGIKLSIGKGVTVGHKVMLHGCQIGDGSLIGMNAVVLNGAVIGRDCLIGANALITEGKHIPDGSVVMGSPGKVVKQVSPEQRFVLEASAAGYVQNASHFRKHLKPL